MAFESLTEKLQNVFKKLRSKGRLTEEDVKIALKEVKMALLEKIDRGEEKLRNLGFGDVRIRVHGTILRLEINPEDFPRILEKREEILLNLEEIGCPYITLDMEGFRSGSMDI